MFDAESFKSRYMLSGPGRDGNGMASSKSLREIDKLGLHETESKDDNNVPNADDDGLLHMESELCESIDFSDEDEAATGIVQRMFHMIRTEACPLLLLIENREVTHIPPQMSCG